MGNDRIKIVRDCSWLGSVFPPPTDTVDCKMLLCGGHCTCDLMCLIAATVPPLSKDGHERASFEVKERKSKSKPTRRLDVQEKVYRPQEWRTRSTRE